MVAFTPIKLLLRHAFHHLSLQDFVTDPSCCRKHYTAILVELQGHSVDVALLKLPDRSGWSFAEAEELPEVCRRALFWTQTQNMPPSCTQISPSPSRHPVKPSTAPAAPEAEELSVGHCPGCDELFVGQPRCHEFCRGSLASCNTVDHPAHNYNLPTYRSGASAAEKIIELPHAVLGTIVHRPAPEEQLPEPAQVCPCRCMLLHSVQTAFCCPMPAGNAQLVS